MRVMLACDATQGLREESEPKRTFDSMQTHFGRSTQIGAGINAVSLTVPSGRKGVVTVHSVTNSIGLPAKNHDKCGR